MASESHSLLSGDSKDQVNVTIMQPGEKDKDDRPTNARGFTLLLQSLSENGESDLRKKKDQILEYNFKEVSFFGLKFRFELIFIFSAAVALLEIVIYIISFDVIDNHGHGDFLTCMALSLPASIGILFMAAKIPGDFDMRGLIFEEFLKEVRSSMRKVGLLMGQEIEARIDEVKLIYRVIGQFITTINVLSDELDKANQRTFSVFDLFTKHFTTIPKPNQIKEYFSAVLRPEYIDWLQAEMHQEEKMLAMAQERATTLKRKIEDEKQKRMLEEQHLAKQQVQGERIVSCCGGSKEDDILLDEPEAKGAVTHEGKALHREAKMNELTEQIEAHKAKLAQLQNLKDTPRVKVKNFQNHVSSTRENVYDVNAFHFDMVGIQLFLDKATANSTPWAQKEKGDKKGSGAKASHSSAQIFEEFLEVKNQAKHSAYLVELDELKKKLENFENKIENSHTNITDANSEMWGDVLQSRSGNSIGPEKLHAKGLCSCCHGVYGHGGEGQTRAMESCREAVKFSVTFWVSVIAIAQIGYTFLVYYEENSDMSRDWLSIPLAVEVLAILAILLIPCYTDTDFAKSSKIMDTLIAEYESECDQMLSQVSKLAAQEKFMSELESIRDNTSNATRDVMIWCKDFERTFELVCAIYESLLYEYEKDKKETLKYAIKPKVDTRDFVLCLECEHDDRFPQMWQDESLDTVNMYQCGKTNCAVHKRDKNHNEFHVYHLPEHGAQQLLRRQNTFTAVREMEEDCQGANNVKEEELKKKREALARRKQEQVNRVEKMQGLVAQANVENDQLQQAAQELLQLVVNGAGPEKTLEYGEIQKKVEIKKVELDDLKQELLKEEEELATYYVTDLHAESGPVKTDPGNVTVALNPLTPSGKKSARA